MQWLLNIPLASLFYFFMSLILNSSAKKIEKTDNFHCYNDYTIADKPFDYLVRNRRIFEQSCGCRSDWKQTFCDNLDRYVNMDVHSAPKVCICRRIDDTDKSCDQFMTRCFWEKNSREKSCKCCFNQPDDHCYQLDCNNLEPDFGRSLNKSCICHDQSVYPSRVCSNSDISPRNRKPGSIKKPPLSQNFYYNVVSDHNMSKNNTILSTVNGLVNDSTWTVVQSNKLILVFAIILLLSLLGAICFGCGVLCFGRMRATRLRRAKRERRSVKEKRLLDIAHNDDVDRYLP